jgi:hypothetical protein
MEQVSTNRPMQCNRRFTMEVTLALNTPTLNIFTLKIPRHK